MSQFFFKKSILLIFSINFNLYILKQFIKKSFLNISILSGKNSINKLLKVIFYQLL